jgi:hypothetical protein
MQTNTGNGTEVKVGNRWGLVHTVRATWVDVFSRGLQRTKSFFKLFLHFA